MRAHLQTAAVTGLASVAFLVAVHRAHAATYSPAYLASGFACIHRFEGAWNANTGNGYFGGLQMDWSFMATYGREYLRAWGTADHWPPSVQIAVAERALLAGRGWWPWPNTARMCGLI